MCVCVCVCVVCVWGGALLKFCVEGILYVFLWTEKDLAFLDRSETDMGTHTQRLQVKMVMKSPILFYEYPFNNIAHYHVLRRYNFSCLHVVLTPILFISFVLNLMKYTCKFLIELI